MQIRSVVLLLSSVLLVGCNAARHASPEAAAAAAPGSPTPLSQADQKLLKEGLAAGMKDPDSVRVGDAIATINGTGRIVICGYVNGKNSYGGYTGDQPFVGLLYRQAEGGRPARFVPLMFGSDEIRETVIRNECRSSGIASF